MRIENEVRLDFKDVLIRPKRSTLSTRSNVDISREFHFRHTQTEYHGVPIIAANMDTTGTFEMAHALDPFLLSTALHKHYAVDEVVAFFKGLERKSAAFYSMGIAAADDEKFGRVMDAAGGGTASAIRYVCIDVANGYTEGFVRLVAKIRERYPHLVIMAGNVVTGEMTEELILSGADIVKVGIGPGSVCTTRKMTGVGYPQLSAIIECADAAHGLEGHICADGGCATPGDVAKAFGGGADFVMLGGMFAGHDECAGDMRGARRPEIPALLRHEQQGGDGEIRWRRGEIPCRRRQGSARAAPRRGRGHGAGDPGRRALGLHLRWRAPAARAVEADHVRARLAAGERDLRPGAHGFWQIAGRVSFSMYRRTFLLCGIASLPPAVNRGARVQAAANA